MTPQFLLVNFIFTSAVRLAAARTRLERRRLGFDRPTLSPGGVSLAGTDRQIVQVWPRGVGTAARSVAPSALNLLRRCGQALKGVPYHDRLELEALGGPTRQAYGTRILDYNNGTYGIVP